MKNNRNHRLEAEIERISPLLARHAKKAFLIGSMAQGRPGLVSDIDLVIVEDTEERYLDRTERWVERLRPACAMDLLVYTPQEFEEMKKRPFLRRALESGRVLFEA